MNKGFTKEEIERSLKNENRRLKRLEEKIKDIEADMTATKGAIEFWNSLLKKVNTFS